MEIHLECLSCGGDIVFRAGRGRTSGRVLGRCTDCRRAFTLQGGKVLTAALPARPQGLWRFGRPASDEPVGAPAREPGDMPAAS
ncbi:hypothetical protein [Aquihabitans sp. McL0605]|uniref:hypothetical protein n=1 Tax=Aquihabitans sp. McL0605 TaxID=3415671 RepID=UPI003CEB362F